MGKNAGILGDGSMTSELLALMEMGMLDPSSQDGNDQVKKLLLMMSLQNNDWMGKIQDYTKSSKKGDGGGGKAKSSGGTSMMSMLELFQSQALVQTFQGVETFLTGVAAGPDWTKIPTVSGNTYDLNNWGTQPKDDQQVIRYL